MNRNPKLPIPDPSGGPEGGGRGEGVGAESDSLHANVEREGVIEKAVSGEETKGGGPRERVSIPREVDGSLDVLGDGSMAAAARRWEEEEGLAKKERLELGGEAIDEDLSVDLLCMGMGSGLTQQLGQL